MLSMLIAYNDDGTVRATLDYVAARDDDGNVVGLVDFEAHELNGGEMTEVWIVDKAKGSKTWPEWIGAAAYDFTVELVGPPGQKRIGALVHKKSGHRRERAVVEAAISKRIADAAGAPADIRDIVGGPDRPVLLDDNGRNLPKAKPNRPVLPVVRSQPTREDKMPGNRNDRAE